jgi:hypothetical protein
MTPPPPNRDRAKARIAAFVASLPDANPNAADLLQRARGRAYRMVELKQGDLADLSIRIDDTEHRLATGMPDRIEGLRLEANAMLTSLGPDV